MKYQVKTFFSNSDVILQDLINAFLERHQDDLNLCDVKLHFWPSMNKMVALIIYHELNTIKEQTYSEPKND